MNRAKRFMAVFVMTLICVVTANAQENFIPKFLGISIDGTKTEMIHKIKEKGFTYNPSRDLLLGEFNGVNAAIFIQTNKNRVWRIGVFLSGKRSNTHWILFMKEG